MQTIKKWGKLGGLLLAVALTVLLGQRSDMQRRYAGEVVRFHVLANSDSRQDQEIKLEVRDRVGAYISEILSGAKSRKETVEILEREKEKIKKVAEAEIRRQGYDYDVAVSLRDEEFPVKFYGAYRLPAGTYTALQVRIGQAEGANWWCVAYPNMCFIDGVYEVAGEQEKERLYQVFTLYEYRRLIESPNKEIRWRLLAH